MLSGWRGLCGLSCFYYDTVLCAPLEYVSCCSSDLCTAFGGKVLPILDVEPIHDLLTQGRRSRVSKTKTLATWATKEVRKLKSAASSW